MTYYVVVTFGAPIIIIGCRLVVSVVRSLVTGERYVNQPGAVLVASQRTFVNIVPSVGPDWLRFSVYLDKHMQVQGNRYAYRPVVYPLRWRSNITILSITCNTRKTTATLFVRCFYFFYLTNLHSLYVILCVCTINRFLVEYNIKITGITDMGRNRHWWHPTCSVLIFAIFELLIEATCDVMKLVDQEGSAPFSF